MDYWTPCYKYQIIEWLNKRFPGRRWKKLNKDQLYAIYFRERRKIEYLSYR